MLKDKVILISGSSRGIGAATAIKANELGAKVILHGKSESDQLKHLANDLQADYITCDVANFADVKKAVSDISNKYPQIDVLVNSAGIVKPKPFLESCDQDWLEEFNINVLGTVHFCQAVIPIMQKNSGGRIVNVSSIRGAKSLAAPRGMSYSASKSAIVNLTASLAKEYAPNIAVNCVLPGFTETDMSKSWNDLVRTQVKTALLQRAAQPSEIAAAILFLASEQASFITGESILVDGGYSLSGK